MGDWIKTKGAIVVGAIAVEAIEHRFDAIELESAAKVTANESQHSNYLKCVVRDRFGKTKTIETSANVLPDAVTDVLSAITIKPIHIHIQVQPVQQAHESGDRTWHATANIEFRSTKPNIEPKHYCENGIDSDIVVAAMTAGLRAMATGNLFSREYRVDNQSFLRDTAKELLHELKLNPNAQKACSAEAHQEALILAALNRVATAAVVTATNHPRSESLLQLYDTTSWLYDEHGKRRSKNTDTKLWLAWYPGFSDDNRIVRDVIDSMPSVPDVAIPAIIRLVENPKSWIALPGAMSLRNHDILHVLLGRGLQDQDEAFVLGFAMGSTKKRMVLRRRLFRWIVSHLYPEPYRIQKVLHPAFEQGFLCGRQTGCDGISKRDLQEFLDMSIRDARTALRIDPDKIRQAFIAERLAIPLTMASLRLDV
jgi:hypothetical protein